MRRLLTKMATYIYETVPHKADEKPRRFEIKQSMNDAALEKHPETGEKIRRVVSGGFGLMTKGGSGGEMGGGHSCGSPGCCS